MKALVTLSTVLICLDRTWCRARASAAVHQHLPFKVSSSSCSLLLFSPNTNSLLATKPQPPAIPIPPSPALPPLFIMHIWPRLGIPLLCPSLPALVSKEAIRQLLGRDKKTGEVSVAQKIATPSQRHASTHMSLRRHTLMETSPHGDTRTSSCLYGGMPLWRHGDTTTRRYAFTETPSQTHAHLENPMAMCFVDGPLTRWGERSRVEQYSNLSSQR